MTTFLYPGDLPKEAELEVIDKFDGGYNSVVPAHKLASNFSPDMRNVFIHRNPRRIISRSGFLKVGIATATLASGRFGFTFYKENGAKEFIVSDDSVVLTTNDFNTYVLISSALNTGVHLNAIQVRNKVWFTNGSDSVFTWDGTNKVTLNGNPSPQGDSTPNVPKFRYLAYDQERVWGLNTSGNGSLVQWTDLISTAGASIAPDHFLAWPAGNADSVGRGDGQVGTALWVYKGQLQAGKERSIFTRYGTNTSNYVFRRTNADVGVASNDSVTVMDGLTYFKGNPPGLYAYDGQDAERISDSIQTDVDLIQDAANQFIENIWDTQNDFARGRGFFGSTATTTGLLQNQVQPITINSAETNPGGTFLQFNSTGAILDTGFSTLTANGTVPFYFYHYPGKVKIWGRSNFGRSPCATTGNIDVSIRNLRTGVQATHSQSPSLFASSDFSSVIYGSDTANNFRGVNFDDEDINLDKSSFTIRVNLSGSADDTCVFDLILPTNTNTSTIVMYPSSSTQFISEIATITTLTAWSTFESVRNTNGGTITYAVRSATSIINTTTQTWVSIVPGVTLNFPTQNLFVQWASTIDTLPTGVKANIDDVRIAHIEGSGSKDRPFAINWNNEWWLSVATETSGNFSRQWVKSWISNPNPNAWMPMDGMNIRCLFKDGNSTLYGGGASTSAFYRLDFGTNDNGNAIDAWYVTPELTMKGGNFGSDGNWTQKQVMELWVDAEAETGNVLTLGENVDGAGFTDESVALDGTGQVLRVLYGHSKKGKYFQYRFRNNQLDKSLRFNSLGLAYIPQRTR